MNTLGAFWLSASIAIVVSVLVVTLLRRSLDGLLVELCGSGGRARFWSTFTSVTIVLTASIGMLASFPLSDKPGWEDYPHLPTVLSAFRTSLVFLLLALGTLGFVLLIGIANYERRRRYELGSRPGSWGGAPPAVRS
jgi:hypothetical protein